MDKRPLERLQNTSNNIDTPAISPQHDSIGVENQDGEISIPKSIHSAGGIKPLSPEVGQAISTDKSGSKIGPWQCRGLYIPVLLSSFSTLTLLLMLAAYRTEWGQDFLREGYLKIAGWAALSLAGLLVLMTWRFLRNRRNVQAIEVNLREVAQVSEDYEEVLRSPEVRKSYWQID